MICTLCTIDDTDVKMSFSFFPSPEKFIFHEKCVSRLFTLEIFNKIRACPQHFCICERQIDQHNSQRRLLIEFGSALLKKRIGEKCLSDLLTDMIYEKVKPEKKIEERQVLFGSLNTAINNYSYSYSTTGSNIFYRIY